MNTDTPITTEEQILSLQNFLDSFSEDSLFQIACEHLRQLEAGRLRLKGLSGSADAILATIAYSQLQQTMVFVLHDKEEAAYFLNDLQNLMPQKEILFFPTSYKKPYQFEEVENANVLQRAEVLNTLSQHEPGGELVVTYPEALTEKVINQKSLLSHTYSAKVGEEVDPTFLAELLIEYDFEKTDFVYEAGQFSVRGGIIDIYSYAHELPFRVELFGDEIESIRTFDPITQLSVSERDRLAIVPNVQTKMLQEVRESFLEFIPKNTKIWVKDLQLTADTIAAYFEKATEDFESILAQSAGTQVISNPEALFETQQSFKAAIKSFVVVEFGNRFARKPEAEVVFDIKPQPSFNKDFNLLAENLQQNQSLGFTNIIAAESPRQLSRLASIFHELDPNLQLQELNLSLRAGFYDKNAFICCYTDHQIFERFHRYYQKKKHSKSKALTLKELQSLSMGDFVTHIDYGVGRFGGMEKLQVGGREQEAIRLIYRDDDLLYVSIHALHKISRYTGQEGKAPTISKLGSPEWENKKSRAKKKVKDIAKELIQLYAKRRSAQGFAFSPDSYLQAELESSFIYEDTPDQSKATQEVKEDMEQPHPMDRLVCGDVGFGKTEVAIRAAFKAVTDSKQVAVLVPTTILAMQHYKTFKDRLEQFPCKVAYINRFKSAADIRQTLKEAEEGKIDILIGTHRITSKDVKFKQLGLLIIDEEQKFGVKTKERIKEFRVNVDTLTLTATPIPRTLHFSLMGARDLSVIATPPPNRQPVTTRLMAYSAEVVRDAVYFELKRGGQVFFVHNRVGDIEEVASSIISLVPDARVAYAHGQMDGKHLEKVMSQFIDHEFDVLVSTNIIESGLDIPNANTIIINRAHAFGLSDLHQMRGRVGRSNQKAFCYLLTPPTIGLSADSRKRLSALEEFTDLGDGFKVAMRDLDIRGAGNLLGGEQSGFISDLGFDMYNKVLDEAVQELKENEFKELFSKELAVEAKTINVDCSVETDLEILIPEAYVANVSERLNLYMAADQLKNEKDLLKFKQSLIDRFGPLPISVSDLLKTVQMRWEAETLGIEKLILKNDVLKAHLLDQEHASYYQSEAFGKILAFVQKNPRQCKLKESKKRLILVIEGITTTNDALNTINNIVGS